MTESGENEEEPGNKERAKKYGKVLLQSLVLAFIINPIVSPVFADMGTFVGIYDRPHLEFGASYNSPDYKAGAEIPRLGNLTWQDGYGVYRFGIVNQGDATAQNIKVRIHFPGCYVKWVSSQSSNGITLEQSVRSSELVQSDGTPVENVYCSKNIRINELKPGEQAVAYFVIDEAVLTEDKVYVDLHTEAEIRTVYGWESHGKYYRDMAVNEPEGMENVKQRVRDNVGERLSDYFWFGIRDPQATLVRGCSYAPAEYYGEGGAGNVVKIERGDESTPIPNDPPCPAITENMHFENASAATAGNSPPD